MGQVVGLIEIEPLASPGLSSSRRDFSADSNFGELLASLAGASLAGMTVEEMPFSGLSLPDRGGLFPASVAATGRLEVVSDLVRLSEDLAGEIVVLRRLLGVPMAER